MLGCHKIQKKTRRFSNKIADSVLCTCYLVSIFFILFWQLQYQQKQKHSSRRMDAVSLVSELRSDHTAKEDVSFLLEMLTHRQTNTHSLYAFSGKIQVLCLGKYCFHWPSVNMIYSWISSGDELRWKTDYSRRNAAWWAHCVLTAISSHHPNYINWLTNLYKYLKPIICCNLKLRHQIKAEDSGILQIQREILYNSKLHGWFRTV